MRNLPILILPAVLTVGCSTYPVDTPLNPNDPLNAVAYGIGCIATGLFCGEFAAYSAPVVAGVIGQATVGDRTNDPARVALRTLADERDRESAYMRGGKYIAEQQSEEWEWLCKAADQGHPKAQVELAKWHRTDTVLNTEPAGFRATLVRDDRVAAMWYQLAADNGSTSAPIELESLTQRLGESVVSDGKKLAGEWRPGNCPIGPQAAVSRARAIE